MHIVVIAKIELRASVSMLQYPGRARKVVHLISNTRLLLLLPLPNCPASSSKIHMLTQPRYAKPHHTISVAVFFHIQYLCLKKKKKKVSSTSMPISRCLANSYFYFKTQLQKSLSLPSLYDPSKLCSIIFHTYICHRTHYIYVLPSLSHKQSPVNHECLQGRGHGQFSPVSQYSGNS